MPTEPDWEKYRIDFEFDPSGVQNQKLIGFMMEFVNWRKAIAEAPVRTNKRSKKPRGAS